MDFSYFKTFDTFSLCPFDQRSVRKHKYAFIWLYPVSNHHWVTLYFLCISVFDAILQPQAVWEECNISKWCIWIGKIQWPNVLIILVIFGHFCCKKVLNQVKPFMQGTISYQLYKLSYNSIHEVGTCTKCQCNIF